MSMGIFTSLRPAKKRHRDIYLDFPWGKIKIGPDAIPSEPDTPMTQAQLKKALKKMGDLDLFDIDDSGRITAK